VRTTGKKDFLADDDDDELMYASAMRCELVSIMNQLDRMKNVYGKKPVNFEHKL